MSLLLKDNISECGHTFSSNINGTKMAIYFLKDMLLNILETLEISISSWDFKYTTFWEGFAFLTTCNQPVYSIAGKCTNLDTALIFAWIFQPNAFPEFHHLIDALWALNERCDTNVLWASCLYSVHSECTAVSQRMQCVFSAQGMHGSVSVFSVIMCHFLVQCGTNPQAIFVLKIKYGNMILQRNVLHIKPLMLGLY